MSRWNEAVPKLFNGYKFLFLFVYEVVHCYFGWPMISVVIKKYLKKVKILLCHNKVERVDTPETTMTQSIFVIHQL